MKLLAGMLLLLRSGDSSRRFDDEDARQGEKPAQPLFSGLCPAGQTPRQSPFGEKAAAFEEVFVIKVFTKPAELGLLQQRLTKNIEVQVSIVLENAWSKDATNNKSACGEAIQCTTANFGILDDTKKSYFLDFPTVPQNFILGTRRVGLRANSKDDTRIREPIAASLYAAMCAHTYRVALAELFLNGEYRGIYVVAEWFNEQFVQREFGLAATTNTWTLWDAHVGNGLGFISDDPVVLKDGCFGIKIRNTNECPVWLPFNETLSIKHGHCCNPLYAPKLIWRGGPKPDDPYKGLQFLVSTLNPKLIHTPMGIDKLSQYFDIDTMLRQMAVDLAIGHFDGYWRGLNNYMIFQSWTLPSREGIVRPQFSMVEFDLKRVFSARAPLDPNQFGDSPPWNKFWPEQPQAPLATHLLRVSNYRLKFYNFLRALVDIFQHGGMRMAVNRVVSVIRKSREFAVLSTKDPKFTGWKEGLKHMDNYVQERADQLSKLVQTEQQPQQALLVDAGPAVYVRPAAAVIAPPAPP